MKKNNKLTSRNISQPRSRIKSEIFFIALTTFGLVFLVALISHSPIETPLSSALEEPITNSAGIVGAYLSDIGLSFLGYSAYLIPISLIWLGYKIHKNAEQKPANPNVARVRFIATIVLIISFSALLALLAQLSTNKGPAGGDIGNILHNYFGVLFGSISIVVYLGVIMISTGIASPPLWKNVFAFIATLFAKFKMKSSKAKATITPTSKLAAKKIGLFGKLRSAKTKPVKRKTTATTNNASLPNNKTLTGLPDLSLLDDIKKNTKGYSEKEIEEMSQQVEIKLKDFGFDVSITAVTPGPVITQFELSLAPGVKVSQIMNLNKDLARALLVESVRIVDVIPGKPVIGLEIPNTQREMIGLKEVLSSNEFNNSPSMLTMGLGKDINGQPVVANLAKMPHLLVAGSTGMGKSVGLNAMILSVLYKATPEQVRIIMIDPKIVELSCYNDVPHLLTPVITDMNQAASALWWCVNEMERRYSLLATFGVRNIEGFNEKLEKAKKKNSPLLDPSFKEETAEEGESAPELESLPLIMLVIDEYADMLGALQQEDRTKAKRVEALIIRLAQKARAAGIHLIIATQRPSVDVITGLIKSNVPSRIAFKVTSKVDSRTILDQGGAEQLLGMGDMLYMTPGISHLSRVHGAFVSDDEIANVVGFLREHSQTNYLNSVVNSHSESTDSHEGTGEHVGETDELYDKSVQIVTSTRRASISSLQRRLRIGYNRAARIIEDMEAAGVVSGMNSAGNRQVLAPGPIDEN
ncbi:DNA translocase FtsK [Bathymodiolus thermophilus thioautotrophic gill symbiont]|uniref:DNA translocase FtsK n=3 Tax=sulfur-oxidizing symbionts TaxID=32036 RepID=A0A1H6KFQ2_9GAMM|nr:MULTISPECIES: DNA translocase FtsK [sulfur-oxidizing symbionts]CAC9531915.1 DNA translocase FtsK [uncultured Gammaproteobacteria bacterium]CAB5503936.1 DNA translocase FtsK [Bathymodiolus azoricus thioautotrophic gill symbiont]CAB5508362.1 DNA translocase FtsK [Bathymodiolus thermophilus thioautotrophic gill symbiont]CAC9537123.1 DNA translocase FtsK [uncultured Gammaproteobacteria bacterium]CAC9547773.1 DNA translocase FtsK [uncultured Gammaproteobacteria bacterium]